MEYLLFPFSNLPIPEKLNKKATIPRCGGGAAATCFSEASEVPQAGEK
ncbi:hypothetical protein [Adlercreutzia mucosicola]|nr:hypothetical protein [Adlercreutzia mucosicola]MCR2034735.1 hypothetical protein [Adlercreutzia mucosicola]